MSIIRYEDVPPTRVERRLASPDRLAQIMVHRETIYHAHHQTFGWLFQTKRYKRLKQHYLIINKHLQWLARLKTHSNSNWQLDRDITISSMQPPQYTLKYDIEPKGA